MIWFWLSGIILITVFRHYYFSATAIGRRGEAKVSAILAALPKEYFVINNIIVKNPNGTTSQIDHLVVSPYGLFSIETKNYKGWIMGSESGQTWSKVMYNRKYSFENPLRQNYGHVKAISSYLKTDTARIHPIVVFGNHANIKVTATSGIVINMHDLLNTITSFQNVVFSEDEMQMLCRILKFKSSATKEETKEHIDTIKDLLNQASHTASVGFCPRCGSHLTHRKGKYGSFIGCSNYPKCLYTQSI